MCDLFYLSLITEKEEGAISTLVIRGSTDNLMDDIERAIDDGVNTFKVLVRVSLFTYLNKLFRRELSIVQFLLLYSFVDLFLG